MKDKQVILSKRLQMLAGMVSPGNRLVDIGCDHGFLSIHLVQQGICPGALAMDVRKGPLTAATEHIKAAGLETYIETRLSDGLSEFRDGEAQTMVCAGMGGPLMEKILTEGMEKVRGLKEIILQPQSELRRFRRFLRMNGFHILQEEAVLEEGKYYFGMKVLHTGKVEMVSDDLFDEYGEILLKTKNPVLQQFLNFRKGLLLEIMESLKDAGTDKTIGRIPQVKREIREIERALKWYV